MSVFRFRPTAALVLLLITPIGCLTEPDTDQRPALRCAEPNIDTGAWHDVSAVTFDYQVPSYYTRPQGSSRWEYGRAWIHVQVLAPGQESVNPTVSLTQYSECHASISGVDDVLVQLGFTSFDAPWGNGWYSSATFEQVVIDANGAPGTVLIESWTPVDTEIQPAVKVYFSVRFRPVGG